MKKNGFDLPVTPGRLSKNALESMEKDEKVLLLAQLYQQKPTKPVVRTLRSIENHSKDRSQLVKA